MSGQQIIMNFTVPPSDDDIRVMAEENLETMPEELMEFCDEVEILVEDFADEMTESDLDLDDPYDLLALYKSSKEISPGVQSKSGEDDGSLILYRRPILDMWCESGEHLNLIIRQIMIEEIGRHFEFTDDEIDEMTSRHYQGML